MLIGTENLFNEAMISKVKRCAFIVNAARKNLRSRRIRGRMRRASNRRTSNAARHGQDRLGIHPHDAERLGLRDRKRVRVASQGAPRPEFSFDTHLIEVRIASRIVDQRMPLSFQDCVIDL
jgi:Molydopterin dinucleotide binding domain